jgi:uncharacterized protein DUF4326
VKQASKIIVANARHIPPNTAAIYIGRKMPGRPASPLGNPFKIQHDDERPEALRKYREWLEEQLKDDTPARREIEKIIEQVTIPTVEVDLALICFCKPKICHGDVVKEIVERIIQERGQDAD